MAKKMCPICKQEKEEDVVQICQAAENYIIERIKKDHPEWVEADGACPKCIDVYKNIK